MTALPSLPEIIVEPIVRRALEEDLGFAGDLTTQATIPAGTTARVQLRARDEGCLAGLQAARTAFRLIDPGLKIALMKTDGDQLRPGDVIAHIEGDARAVLTGERVALNFLGHLSGVATATRELVSAIADTHAKICCTRKTTPGLRALEKHAVLLGGGSNHRFGLDDAILIKDNHIAVAGGVTAALNAAQAAAGHLVAIEIEVDTLGQLKDALSANATNVLLDNMSTEELCEAVEINKGRAILEASGRVTVNTVRAIAESGVDYISSGAITHSAKVLDIGLDFEVLT